MTDKLCEEETKQIYSEDINPEDIKPYVAVGLSETYSVSVYKSTFDTGFILLIIIFGAALIAIIIITILVAYNRSKLDDPPPGIPLNIQSTTNLGTNYGGVNNAQTFLPSKIVSDKDECLSLKNAEWINDHCECKIPYFGYKCSQEKYDKKYFSVGVPDLSTLNISVIDTFETNNKTFNNKPPYDTNGSCSDICNNTTDCIGFIYQNNICHLLSDNVVVPKNYSIPYSNDIESTLYMTSSDNLHFEGRVFLGEYLWSFPPRYWLFKESFGYAQLIPNIVTRLNFYPNYIKIHGNYTGIYALNIFSYNNVQDIIKYGDSSQFYIHQPNTILNLPEDWKYKTPLYAVYF